MPRFKCLMSAKLGAMFCLLTVAVVTAPARGQQPTTAQGLLLGGIWDHNGSVMYTSVIDMSGETAEFEINYATPKNGLAKQGVKSGTVVFRGRLEGGMGNNIVGQAFTFRKDCAPAAYAVTGVVSEPRRGREAFIQLLGAAPVRAASGCGINGYSDKSSNAMLMFEYRGSGE